MLTRLLQSWIVPQMRSPQSGVFGWIAQRVMTKVNPVSSIEIVKQLQLDNCDDASLTVVELGPGNGFSLTELVASKKCRHIHGIEISERFRALLDDKFKAEIDSGLLSIHPDDAKDLSFLETSSVDCIYALNVIYFLDPLDAYLKEMRRICKPGGRIIFGVSDTVKRNDEVVFVNQDWKECADKLSQAGFSDVGISSEIDCGMYSFKFISGTAN